MSSDQNGIKLEISNRDLLKIPKYLESEYTSQYLISQKIK